MNKRDVDARKVEAERQSSMLRGSLHPNVIFMEIGPGDCTLTLRVANRVSSVYAIDVSREITDGVDAPRNFQLKISDGVIVPAPEGSIDIAYSNQLMEHLYIGRYERVVDVHIQGSPFRRHLCMCHTEPIVRASRYISLFRLGGDWATPKGIPPKS